MGIHEPGTPRGLGAIEWRRGRAAFFDDRRPVVVARLWAAAPTVESSVQGFPPKYGWDAARGRATEVRADEPYVNGLRKERRPAPLGQASASRPRRLEVSVDRVARVVSLWLLRTDRQQKVGGVKRVELCGALMGVAKTTRRGPPIVADRSRDGG